MKLRINDAIREVPDTLGKQPLLWALRELLGLTGTRFGCGIGACGACTVHLDGKAARSCQVSCEGAVGAEVTTIEGLARADSLHEVQRAWIAERVPQCGFCQSGQIMAAAALLARIAAPTDEDIDAAMSGNLCRCGTYPRIRRAVHAAARGLGGAR
jgi:isoquinoline 1-oxidoreductase subunit alpha